MARASTSEDTAQTSSGGMLRSLPSRSNVSRVIPRRSAISRAVRDLPWQGKRRSAAFSAGADAQATRRKAASMGHILSEKALETSSGRALGQIRGPQAAEAGEHTLEHRTQPGHAPQADHQVPAGLELLPAGGVGEVPQPATDRVLVRRP